MQGIGRIFEAYRDGVITDDDEVAVVHGPQEMGYRARTVPLVNIRATLELALKQGVITEQAHRVLIDAARSLFYWDRTYGALIEKCEACVDGQILDKFSDWVSDNAVDQKRYDAIEMLERVRELPVGPLRVTYQFQRTSAWENLIEEVRAHTDNQAPESLQEHTAQVLDELRLDPLLYRQVLGASPSRERKSLHATESPNPFSLIESDYYEELAARAADKHRVLNAEYGDVPEYADAMLTPSEVLDWYFEDSCGTTVPMDLEGYAAELGLSSSGELCRLLLHELLYEMARDVGQVNGASI